MKRLSGKMIKYELLNTAYNGYAFFFGLVFPCAMLYLLTQFTMAAVPDVAKEPVYTSVFLGMSTIIPMTVGLMSYAASSANEEEKNVPIRLTLYGISPRTQLAAKVIANVFFLFLCEALYFAFSMMVVEIPMGQGWALPVFILMTLVFAISLMMMAQGIVGIFRQFGIVYGIVMGLYFVLLALSGYMGVQVSDLPKALQIFSDYLPSKHFGNGFESFWLGGTYDFSACIRAHVIFFVLSALIFVFRVRHRGRRA